MYPFVILAKGTIWAFVDFNLYFHGGLDIFIDGGHEVVGGDVVTVDFKVVETAMDAAG